MKNALMGAALGATLASTALFAPTPAQACGGLFCNTAQPVNQSAERILFAQDPENPERMHMHVQIQYAGPPTEFGWLLPVPPDVETELGSEELFRQMDQQFAPQFQLNTEFVNCDDANFRNAAPTAEAGDSAGGLDGGQNPGVQVLSREAVGPFDRTIIQADSVEDLRRWLDENEYQIPQATDEKLEPYIEQGSVFVALKLLPGTDSGDVQPLHLTFTSPQAGVPIQPTAVAADPDMGVIVHVLGDVRAIPSNYAHVEVNDALIDWVNGGQNYQDVVSHAVDEAENGHAFATDYAGSTLALPGSIQEIPDGLIESLETRVETWEQLVDLVGGTVDADLVRVLGMPEGVQEDRTAQQYWQCPRCFEGDLEGEVDGPALAARIEEEINGPRKHITELLDAHGYLTRMFTTLSASEMTRDPLFSFNPDLDEVANVRTATRYIICRTDGSQEAVSVETPSGYRVALDENGQQFDVLQRQDGATIRGGEAPGAILVARLMESGQPAVIQDNRERLADRYNDEESGCSCDVSGREGPSPMWGLLMVGLVALRPRRRQ